ncbi:MAG: universal stress protein [Nocardioidaceae bacterium]
MTSEIIRVAADGSPGSRRALAWAVAEAARRSCGVEVVTVYQREPGQSAGAARAAAEARARATMEGQPLDSAHRAAHRDLPTLSWHAVEGDPADVLVRESEQSMLLVMGSHSMDGIRHAVLGSVADTCARTAACPVVIVPPEHRNLHAPHEELSAATVPGQSDHERSEQVGRVSVE